MVVAANDIEILNSISRLGVVAFLVVAMYGFYKMWWVFGKHHREIVADKDEVILSLNMSIEQLRVEKNAWMNTALRSTDIAATLKEELKRGGP